MRLVYLARPEDEGRKVYHVLKNTLSLSAEQIKRLKRAGAVYVDGKGVFMDRRLAPGETLEADLAATETAPDFPPEEGELDIIFENDAFLGEAHRDAGKLRLRVCPSQIRPAQCPLREPAGSGHLRRRPLRPERPL